MSASILVRLTSLILILVVLMATLVVPGTTAPVEASPSSMDHGASQAGVERVHAVATTACLQARVYLPLIMRTSTSEAVVSPATTPPIPTCSTPPPPAEIAALARRVLAPASEDDARKAIAEIFAKAGVATVFDSGAVQQAAFPTMPFHLRQLQTQTLAADAALRAQGGWRLTMAELSTLLYQLGWQLPDGGDGTIFTKVLAQAIQAAHADPDSPHSFTPLFLQAMAQATTPGLDLGSGIADPTQIALSAMEAELFLFLHLRVKESYGSDVAITSTASAATPSGAVTANASSPCADFENALGQLDPLRIIKAAFLAGIDKVVGIPFEMFYEKLGITDKAGKLAIANALNLINIVMTTRAINFSVATDKPEAHASHAEMDDVLRIGSVWNNVTFDAAASAKNVYADYPVLADCLKLLGLFGPENMDEVLEKARVVWDPRGLGTRARVGKIGVKNARPDFNPYIYALGKDRKTQLVVDMNPEPGGPYPNNPIELQQRVFMTASLDTSQMPDFKDLIKAVIPGGLPDAILGIANQAIKKMIAPTRKAEFVAKWHPAPCGTASGNETVQSAAAASSCPYTVSWSRIYMKDHETTIDNHFNSHHFRTERHGSALVYLEPDPENPLATVLNVPTASIVVTHDERHESRYLGEWYYGNNVCASRSESGIMDGTRWAGRHTLRDIRAYGTVPYRHTNGLTYWPINELRALNQPYDMTTFADYTVKGWSEDTICDGQVKRREFSTITDAVIGIEKSPPDEFSGGSYIKGDATGTWFAWTGFDERTSGSSTYTTLETWTVEAPCGATTLHQSEQPQVAAQVSTCR